VRQIFSGKHVSSSSLLAFRRRQIVNLRPLKTMELAFAAFFQQKQQRIYSLPIHFIFNIFI
jgi:hypothetical protein